MGLNINILLTKYWYKSSLGIGNLHVSLLSVVVCNVVKLVKKVKLLPKEFFKTAWRILELGYIFLVTEEYFNEIY